MWRRELIVGPNFSGRSEMLRAWLDERAGATFFLGPYAEAALSGLSNTILDEIEIYRADGAIRRATFAPLEFGALGTRKPATLSGGEQVLLALHCFSRSAYDAVGIDTALEQLDRENRAAALRYLCAGCDFHIVLIDNRLERMDGWGQREAAPASVQFAGELDALLVDLRPRAAPAIAIRGLNFAYRAGEPIFQGIDLALAPGRAYRLTGRNGAGKTTLLRILVGVLAPSRGTILLDEARYDPRREGNRVIALATQNPDHQWCGATLAEDMARRRKAARGAEFPSDALIATLARKLGLASPDQHLYELPLAVRKRASWLWPFSGAMPWIMLDEPTVGQDRLARAALATILSHLCAIGYGVIVVTHDDEFADRLPHQVLRIEDKTIRT